MSSGGTDVIPTHPLTFKPEFIDAFELGTKNTLLDGALTFNGDVFYYNYKGYQISEIVDRTAINLQFQRPCERRRTRIDLGADAGPAVQFRRRLGRHARSPRATRPSI